MTCDVNCWSFSSIYLDPNQSVTYWFSADWTQFNSVSAGPNSDAAAGASVQITAVSATQGQIWVQFHNNGSVGVSFTPRFIITNA
jgi:hypothetical protein